jgi:hypothetical protein
MYTYTYVHLQPVDCTEALCILEVNGFHDHVVYAVRVMNYTSSGRGCDIWMCLEVLDTAIHLCGLF